MPSKTLGDIVNSALKEVGEPEVEEFTADNILQQRMIEAANNAVRNLVDRLDYDWRLKRTTLVTVDDITTGSAAVTKGDATVSSVDSDGDAATNFTCYSSSISVATSATVGASTAVGTSKDITDVVGDGETYLTVEIDTSDATHQVYGGKITITRTT